jgi:hypothetical protein
MTLQLRVGGYYRSLAGDVLGPMIAFNREPYAFAVYGGGSWTDQGFYLGNKDPSRMDLITECTPDGTPIQEKPMPKYDEKLVDELLSDIEGIRRGFNLNGDNYAVNSMFEKASALRPKPTKFHVMPTWEEFVVDKTIRQKTHDTVLHVYFYDGYKTIEKADYNALREATASEKPLVHIPAGDKWEEDDLRDVFNEYVRKSGRGEFAGTIAVVDAIKAKLESKE